MPVVRRRTKLAFASAAALAGLVVLLVSVLGSDPRPPLLRANELPAEELVDSMGVNVHFTYTDTAYARQAEVLARLQELGIRHVRDAMPSPVDSPLAAGLKAASLQGVRATLLPHDPVSDPGPLISDSVKVLGNSIDAFEGPNEPDNSGDPGWAQKLLTYMPMLEDRVRRLAPGVPLIAPSLVYASSRSEALPRVAGVLNAHPYSGGAPPEPALGDAVRELADLEQGHKRGMVFTEAGYHNAMNEADGQPPVSEEAAAVYIPRLLVTAFGAGARRTFLYELVDEKPDPALADQEQHFGLLRNDLSPKPAFTAVKTLIAALRTSPGPSTRTHVPWAVVPQEPGEVKRLLLRRPDGSHVIALWRPVSVWDQDSRQPRDPGEQPVDLNFGGWTASDVAVWRPSVSTAPVETHDSSSGLHLRLAGDLVLVSFR
jgi:hypothetical protein